LNGRGNELAALNPDRLRPVLKDAVRGTFRDLKSRYPDERFYAFALYTAGEAEYVLPTANTEEGLRRRAEGYVRRGYAPPETGAASLRWNPADWAYHLEGDEPYFGEVERLLMQAPEPHDLEGDTYRARVDGVFETCLAALEELDAEGLFGRGEERQAIVINLLKGDQSNEEMLECAKRLNPRAAYARFAAELPG